MNGLENNSSTDLVETSHVGTNHHSPPQGSSKMDAILLSSSTTSSITDLVSETSHISDVRMVVPMLKSSLIRPISLLSSSDSEDCSIKNDYIVDVPQNERVLQTFTWTLTNDSSSSLSSANESSKDEDENKISTLIKTRKREINKTEQCELITQSSGKKQHRSSDDEEKSENSKGFSI
jgi:hypothetical protein